MDADSTEDTEDETKLEPTTESQKMKRIVNFFFPVIFFKMSFLLKGSAMETDSTEDTEDQANSEETRKKKRKPHTKIDIFPIF